MCREDGKWIASAESRSVRGASHQPNFMGDCSTICHMYLPCLPGEWVSFVYLVLLQRVCMLRGREGVRYYQKNMLLWVMVRWQQGLGTVSLVSHRQGEMSLGSGWVLDDQGAEKER